jgi:hypothetical protein
VIRWKPLRQPGHPTSLALVGPMALCPMVTHGLPFRWLLLLYSFEILLFGYLTPKIAVTGTLSSWFTFFLRKAIISENEICGHDYKTLNQESIYFLTRIHLFKCDAKTLQSLNARGDAKAQEEKRSGNHLCLSLRLGALTS